MIITKEVKVEILNGVREEELQKMLSEYINNGYEIQNSQVEWYCGTIQGVYVFVREKPSISKVLVELELHTDPSRRQVVYLSPSDFERTIEPDNPPTDTECAKIVEKEFFLGQSGWKFKRYRLIF